MMKCKFIRSERELPQIEIRDEPQSVEANYIEDKRAIKREKLTILKTRNNTKLTT